MNVFGTVMPTPYHPFLFGMIEIFKKWRDFENWLRGGGKILLLEKGVPLKIGASNAKQNILL